MKGDLDKQFESKGFTVLGWGDAGAAKTMSVGFEIHGPSDMQGKGTFVIAGDASSSRMQALPQRFKDVMAAHGAELSDRLATMVRTSLPRRSPG
jgi:hypothetical protein